MEFLKQNQLNILLFLSGVCAAMWVMVFFSRSIPIKRRNALGTIELCATLLLISDRLAYIYRGKPGDLARVMVRVSNFGVFMMVLVILKALNQYLKSILSASDDHNEPSALLRAADIVIYIDVVMTILTQFTGFYYYFDEFNRYQRGSGIFFSVSLPLLAFVFQLSDIMRRRERLSTRMLMSLIIFTTLPVIASTIQLFAYGISLTSISIVAPSMLLYLFSLIEMNEKVEKAKDHEIELLKEEQEAMQQLFEQTAMALAGAIDAKDKYTHGHSRRVAEYSQRIAEYAGKSHEEVQDIYYSALLHDAGKIGVPDVIINKEGRLTDEEFAAIKTHPSIGSQILSSINISPSLSIGASYHHERYDGRGYPSGLKGDDIPEIARIIAVADAYDAMTSKRSYREPMPQQLVREELVKGSGTQFDPVYAKIMLHLIDVDTEYNMKEHETIKELSGNSEMVCTEFRTEFSEGVIATREEMTIHLNYISDDDDDPVPTLILFDSLDQKIHCDDTNKKIVNYFEYCEIRLDGHVERSGAREIQNEIIYDSGISRDELLRKFKSGIAYDITAVKYNDHVRVRIENEYRSIEVIAALPDNSRYVFLSFTGRNCRINSFRTQKTGVTADENSIKRIAPEISYIKVPAGNVPNIQIDGWRTAYTNGEELVSEMKIFFHAMSLPTARLIWHCPFIVLYSSDNGKIKGPNYRELALIRFDGECWDEKRMVNNDIQISRTDDFTGWENWKNTNKQGADCNAQLVKNDNIIDTNIEYNGLVLKIKTQLPKGEISKVYVSITGDQCAITNIWIK